MIDQLADSLKEDSSAANLKNWRNLIIDQDIPLMNLVSLLDKDPKVAMYFSWLIGDIVANDPNRVLPAIPYLFKIRNKVPVKGFPRSLAKMMYYADIPKSIEGTATDELFKWLMDPKSNVSTKRFAALALAKFSSKYPDLQQELIIVLEDEMMRQNKVFQKLAAKIIAGLQK